MIYFLGLCILGQLLDEKYIVEAVAFLALKPV